LLTPKHWTVSVLAEATLSVVLLVAAQPNRPAAAMAKAAPEIILDMKFSLFLSEFGIKHGIVKYGPGLIPAIVRSGLMLQRT